MKVLALGDPHGKLPKNLDSIIKKNNIEIIICIGEVFPIKRDKKNRGKADMKTGEKILDKLCSHKIPMIFFKGNMFLSGEGLKIFQKLLKKYEDKYPNLKYKRLGKFEIKGMNFIVFDMIYEEHSHQFLSKYFTDKKKNKKRIERLNKLLKENKEAILLSHAPPYRYLDKIHSGEHIGSKFLLDAINKNSPKLVLCGHIHEAKGKAKIGKTEIYNLGCCGDYKIFDF
jgi:hypothetical protein